MEEKLTVLEAYKAMITFLDDYYFRFGMHELGGILGPISLMPNGKPADAAAWDDWLAAVKKVLEEEQK
jgi:hypothetical protein